MTDHLDGLRATAVAEVGAPVALTHGPQVATPIGFLASNADLAGRYPWRVDRGDADSFGASSHRWIEREPVGVVGAIARWNFPTQINLAKLAPALAAGCTVVLEPAPDTPWSATVLGVDGGNDYGADVPIGGSKQSGIGREMGVPGFEEYLQAKSLAEPATRPGG